MCLMQSESSPTDPRAALRAVQLSMYPEMGLSGSKRDELAEGYISASIAPAAEVAEKIVAIASRSRFDLLEQHYDVTWLHSPAGVGIALGNHPRYILIDESFVREGLWSRYLTSQGHVVGALRSLLQSAETQRLLVFIYAPEPPREHPPKWGLVTYLPSARYISDTNAGRPFPKIVEILQLFK